MSKEKKPVLQGLPPKAALVYFKGSFIFMDRKECSDWERSEVSGKSTE